MGTNHEITEGGMSQESDTCSTPSHLDLEMVEECSSEKHPAHAHPLDPLNAAAAPTIPNAFIWGHGKVVQLRADLPLPAVSLTFYACISVPVWSRSDVGR